MDTTVVKHGGNSNSTTGNGNSNSINKLYKGVRLRKWGKWVSEIRLPNSRQRIWLGSYDSAEKAARAFDAALYCLRGPHATFNFPNTPFDLDINLVAASQSLTHQQILQIAQNFANKKDHHIPPTHNNEEEEQQQPQQPSLLTSTSATATSSSTQSSMNNIDWTFLNVLDHQSSNAAVASSTSSDNYALFSNLEKMHSGDFTYSTPFFEEQIEAHIDFDIDDDNDPFSHQSFLWSWNF